MGINEIADSLKAQVKNWRAGKPVTPQILQLLEQAYHSPDFPRELDDRCNELYKEVGLTISDWPSLDAHDDHKPVLEHIENFANLLLTKPEQLSEPGSEYSRPMTKLDIMDRLGIDSYRTFNEWAKQHGLKQLNHSLFQICIDKMSESEKKKLRF